MTVIRKSALVPYSAAQMYGLVADAESYPEFLPWCRSVQIHSGEGEEVMGTLELVKGPVNTSFTTVNRLVRDERIEIRLVKGPFKRLEGLWQFQAIGNQGCRVSLDLKFEFSNRLLARTVGSVFNGIANHLVDAFSRRASELYGKR